MDRKLLAVLSLRSLALLFAGQGNAAASNGLNLAASAIEKGINVDAEMKEVNDRMAAGVPPDWQDLTDRINAAGDRIQSHADDPG